MNGQLVQVCCPSGSSPELIDPVENSSREVVELRAEVERLRRENLEFRQQVGYWKSRHRDALLRIAALEQKVEQLEGENRQLQADLFGRRSETTPLKDRSNHLDDPQDETHAPGQVFHLSAHRTLAELVAVVGLAPGTITDGLRWLEVVLRPIYEA